MKGNYSNKIKKLRQKLINFASLIELELDFSDEDVEFADRTKLLDLLSHIKNEITYLIKSFSLGNVLKNGIPVTIIGKPNVGKSTLLNALLNEEKAITSKIPGTTRDIIEDTLIINNICFRFIDTAGLKKTTKNEIEKIGIKKTYQKIEQAEIILYVFDICNTNLQKLKKEINEIKEKTTKRIIIIGNKIDKLVELPKQFKNFVELETIFISAKRKENINLITDSLLKSVNTEDITKDNVVVSNARHYEALSKILKAIQNVETGINNNIYTELLDVDLRDALHYLGEITGQVTDNEILNNIFGKFCIGK
jgi:tRNA modification GTPase